MNAVYTGSTLCAGALVLLYMYQDKLLYFPTIPGASKFTRDNPPGMCVPQRFNALLCGSCVADPFVR